MTFLSSRGNQFEQFFSFHFRFYFVQREAFVYYVKRQWIMRKESLFVTNFMNPSPFRDTIAREGKKMLTARKERKACERERNLFKFNNALYAIRNRSLSICLWQHLLMYFRAAAAAASIHSFISHFPPRITNIDGINLKLVKQIKFDKKREREKMPAWVKFTFSFVVVPFFVLVSSGKKSTQFITQPLTSKEKFTVNKLMTKRNEWIDGS